MTGASSPNFVELAAGIVSAFVSNNRVAAAEMPALIGSVHTALRMANAPRPQDEAGRPNPSVLIDKTVRPDFLISLEDGRPYKSLKPHLRARGLTPDQYREKWRLPADYPMVAPNYSALRSELARGFGLGRSVGKGHTRRSAPEDDRSPRQPRGKVRLSLSGDGA